MQEKLLKIMKMEEEFEKFRKWIKIRENLENGGKIGEN